MYEGCTEQWKLRWAVRKQGNRTGLILMAQMLVWGCRCSGMAPGSLSPEKINSLQAEKINSVLDRRIALLSGLREPEAPHKLDGTRPPWAVQELRSVFSDSAASPLEDVQVAGPAQGDPQRDACQETHGRETNVGYPEYSGSTQHGTQRAEKSRQTAEGAEGRKRTSRTWEERVKEILGPSSEEERAEQLSRAQKALAV